MIEYLICEECGLVYPSYPYYAGLKCQNSWCDGKLKPFKIPEGEEEKQALRDSE